MTDARQEGIESLKKDFGRLVPKGPTYSSGIYPFAKHIKFPVQTVKLTVSPDMPGCRSLKEEISVVGMDESCDDSGCIDAIENGFHKLREHGAPINCAFFNVEKEMSYRQFCKTFNCS